MAAFRCAHCGGINRVPERRIADRPVCGRCKQALDTTGSPQPVSAADLARTVDASPVPVLVDFWAPWCGPCRMAAPMLARVAKSRAGRVMVLKLNSDENPDAARRHRIQGIPAFIVFQNGSEVGRQVGLPQETSFLRWVDQVANVA